MWLRRFLIAAAVLISIVVMPARPALACSCAPSDPASTLDEIPAADALAGGRIEAAV